MFESKKVKELEKKVETLSLTIDRLTSSVELLNKLIQIQVKMCDNLDTRLIHLYKIDELNSKQIAILAGKIFENENGVSTEDGGSY